MRLINQSINQMDKVIIYGTGRHAELVAWEMKKYHLNEVVAFTVKEEHLTKEEVNGLPVVPYEKITEIYSSDTYKMFIAVGPQLVNRAREELYLDAKAKGYSFANCVCPSPNFPEDIVIGENVYIDAFSWFSGFIEIGNNVTIIASMIGHHCKIGDNCFISASTLAGNVTLEKNVFVGLSSTLGPNITLGEYTVLGMGCTVSKNTEPASVYLNQATQKQRFDSSKIKLL